MKSVDETMAERAKVLDIERAPVRSRSVFNVRVFASEASLVVGAAVLANIFSYLFHFTVSRQLGPRGIRHFGNSARDWGNVGSSRQRGRHRCAAANSTVCRASHCEDRIAAFVVRVGRGVLTAGVILAVIVALTGIGFGQYVHVRDFAIWGALGVWSTIGLLATFVRGAARGAHRFGVFSASLVVEGVFKLALTVLLVALGLHVFGAVCGLLGATIAGVIVAMILPISRGARVVPAARDDVPPADQRFNRRAVWERCHYGVAVHGSRLRETSPSGESSPDTMAPPVRLLASSRMESGSSASCSCPKRPPPPMRAAKCWRAF